MWLTPISTMMTIPQRSADPVWPGQDWIRSRNQAQLPQHSRPGQTGSADLCGIVIIVEIGVSDMCISGRRLATAPKVNGYCSITIGLYDVYKILSLRLIDLWHNVFCWSPHDARYSPLITYNIQLGCLSGSRSYHQWADTISVGDYNHHWKP